MVMDDQTAMQVSPSAREVQAPQPTVSRLILQEATAEARRPVYGCCEDDAGESKSASIPTSPLSAAGSGRHIFLRNVSLLRSSLQRRFMTRELRP